jgi:hypothetical protein
LDLAAKAEIALRDQGILVAYIATGGDSGRAPARRLYETLSYRVLPSAQCFKAIRPEHDIER